MAQLRRAALAGALANVVLGLVLSCLAQLALYPALGIRAGLLENMKIAASFTGLSLARSYALRRLFNAHRRTGK
jgi:hypothetical protein